jgi:hypothetical protein
MRFHLTALTLLALATPALAQQQTTPPTCEASEYRAFDF